MGRAPKRFAADSLTNSDAATRGQLERMKREWRGEWEAEQRAAMGDPDEILLSINAKLEKMRQSRLDAMSPETCKLERAYQESWDRDRENGLRGGFDPDPSFAPPNAETPDDTPHDPPRLPSPPDA